MTRHCLFHILLTTCLLASTTLFAQDTLKIHFLHGSKPAKPYAKTEPHWFGGKIGGHVGIGFAPDSILNFLPQGKFHKIAQRDPKHSHFSVLNPSQFWNIFGGSEGALKTTSISIPIDQQQAQQFRGIVSRYLEETPYDYAFFGIRCASSTDEILAKLSITRKRSYWGTILGTFHPKVLRKRLLRMAWRKGWAVERTEGSGMRVWQQ